VKWGEREKEEKQMQKKRGGGKLSEPSKGGTI